MKKNKKGSSIIMVLAIAMIIVVLGTTMVSAVTYAAKMNVFSKNDTDLSISAENGIEYGLAKLRENIIINNTFHDLNASSYVSDVKVEVTVDPSDIDLVTIKSTSTAIDSKQVTISQRYNRNQIISTDIFRFGLAAGRENIKVEGTASIGFGSTSTNSGTPQDITISGSMVDASPSNRENNKYTSLNFISKFKEKESLNIVKVSDLEGTLYLTDGNGVRVTPTIFGDIVPDESAMSNIDGVVRFTSDGYTVYLVRAKELVISQDGSDNVDKNIIICSGTIKIKPNLGGTLNATNTTIYGSKVLIEQNGSVFMTYSPKGGSHTGNMNELDDTKLQVMGQKINKFIKNFSPTPPAGPTSTTWEKEQGSYKKE
ncbi:hypothetical protein ACQPU1_14605 [Clostridium paraputrificum]|uniref:hypothetical protein n=1 Tax=Clostridium paraputrificum TaxID=29363 RepID=UPI003D34D3AD